MDVVKYGDGGDGCGVVKAVVVLWGNGSDG